MTSDTLASFDIGPHNGDMAFLLLVLLVLAAFFFMRKRVKSSRPQSSVEVEYALPMSKQAIEAERKANEEVLHLLEASIIKSGLFRAEKIPELMEHLRSESVPFGRVNTAAAFDGDVLLTVEEKRALGLSTRMKYSKRFIEYFEPSALKENEPKSALSSIHLDAFFRVSRKKELFRMKENGILKVKIVPTGDALDCKLIKRFKKIHNIEELPELPIPGCDAEYCRCYYEAIPPKDG